MKLVWAVFGMVVLLAWSAGVRAEGEQQFADLGDCALESGQVITGCRIGYRTYGKLNEDKSNAVLYPTWFSGTTEELAEGIGPWKLVDSSRHFVITVDALGNGVSSSPSNSPTQGGAKFPAITIKDMIETQYRLLRQVLGVEHLHAVIGVSMGGAQALQWAVTYPDMMDKVISLVGGPRLTAYDLLLWNTEAQAIELARQAGDGNKALPVIAGIHGLALATPAYRNRHTSPKDFGAFVVAEETQLGRRFRADDWAAQVRAIMSFDVAKDFGGSLSQAAARVKASVLIVVSEQDHMVNPQPALEFATLLHVEPFAISGDCGHRAFLDCGGIPLGIKLSVFLNN